MPPSRSHSYSSSSSSNNSKPKIHHSYRSSQASHSSHYRGREIHRRSFSLITRLSSAGLSVIAISLLAAAIPRWNANFRHNSGPARGDWTDGMSIAPLAVSFLTNLLAVTCSTRSSSHEHQLSSRPNRLALVSDLLLFICLLPILSVAAAGSLFPYWRATVRSSDGKVLCNSASNVFAEECRPALYSVGRLQLGGIALGGAVCVQHFLLFLVAYVRIRRSGEDKMQSRRRTLNGWYSHGTSVAQTGYQWNIQAEGNGAYHKFDRYT